MLILQTERLDLFHFTTRDAPFLLDVMNHPDYHRYVGDRGLRSCLDAETYIEDKIIPPYEQGFGFWMVRQRGTGERLGFAGLAKRETLNEPDVGYAIHESHAGKGYAQEATRGILRYARDSCDLVRLGAITDPGNAASINVLIKCGFCLERQVLMFDEETLNLYTLDLVSQIPRS